MLEGKFRWTSMDVCFEVATPTARQLIGGKSGRGSKNPQTHAGPLARVAKQRKRFPTIFFSFFVLCSN